MSDFSIPDVKIYGPGETITVTVGGGGGKTMTKTEAQHAMIDGHKITHPEWIEGCHEYFDGRFFMFYGSITNDYKVSTGLIYDDGYEIYNPKPKPKFTVGQFVDYDGCYYRITEVYWVGGPNKYRYFATNGIPMNNILVYEDALEEVTNE